MGDGVVMLDGRGVPVLANEAYRRMFGERPNGGIPPLPATDAEGRVAGRDATIESLVARGEPFSVQFALAGPDGALRRYEATGQPVHRGEHADGGTVITIRELAT